MKRLDDGSIVFDPEEIALIRVVGKLLRPVKGKEVKISFFGKESILLSGVKEQDCIDESMFLIPARRESIRIDLKEK